MKVIATLMLLAVVGAAGADEARPKLIGDYDMELRAGDHVDNALMVQRLKDLGANTYMWLVWHNANDWEDLKAFLPLAKQAGISVWAYLCPQSESTLQDPGWPYSEPFRLDFVKWAQEIAKLSLQNDNLIGYVIDDFWGNVFPDRFSPEYIKRMVAAGKAVNPKLRFYPLMYFPEIGPHFLETVAPLVDGVVAAYPQSRQEMLDALAFLNDEFHLPAGIEVVYPTGTHSKPGDQALLTQTCKVTGGAKARLSFRYLDNFQGPTAGYHFLQVRVDDKVVWEEDVEGRDDGTADVDLAAALAGKQQVRLSIGVCDKQGVSEFGVCAAFSDLKATGLELAQPDLSVADAWPETLVGAFTVTRHPASEGKGRFHLPLIAMVAGQRVEFENRHHEKATPEAFARHTAEAVQLLREGKLEGVVMYCLDKTPGNPDLDAVRDVFATMPESARQAPVAGVE